MRLIDADKLLVEVVKTQALEPNKAVAKIIMLITQAPEKEKNMSDILIAIQSLAFVFGVIYLVLRIAEFVSQFI